MKIYYILVLYCFNIVYGYSQALSLDQSFLINYSFDNGREILGISKRTDGKLFCFGQFSTLSNLNLRNGIVIDTTGIVDPIFLITPVVNNAIGYADTISGGLLLHAIGEGYRKVDLFGNDIDPTFQSVIATNLPSAIVNMSLESFYSTDNKLISGCTPNPCTYPATNPTKTFFLFKLLSNGMYDSTFTHDVDGPVTYIRSFSDSIIFVSGNFTQYDTFPSTKLVKVNGNFEIDTTFTSIFIWGDVYPAFLQDDGKLIITGQFSIQGIQDTLAIIRLLSNGQLDSTFNNDAVVINSQSGLGFNTALHSVCKTTDNGYLIGGVFSEYDGYARGSIVKTDQNGNIDLAYLNGSGFDSHPYPLLGLSPSVSDIEIGSDDKYYISGSFNGFNGQAVPPLIRLNQLLTNDNEIGDLAPSLSIFPNPSNNILNISFGDCNLNEGVPIFVTNIMGQEILSTHWSKTNNKIDISNLSRGLYFINIVSDSFKISGKFLKID